MIYKYLDCTGLKSVTIPSSVTSIGGNAFNGCYNLVAVYCYVIKPLSISSNTFSNRTNAKLYVSSNSLFAYQRANCWNEFKEIKVFPDSYDIWLFYISNSTSTATIEGTSQQSDNLTIPPVVYKYGEEYIVTSISAGAFSGQSGLTSVTIPSSVTNIGEGAFNGCSSLTTVYCYVKTPFSISSGTFSNRANATLYVPYEAMSAYQKANYWKEFKEIKAISDSDGTWQFVVSNSTAIILGTSQQSEYLTIPSVIYKDGKEYPVTSIEAGAFSGQSDLTSVTIPESVTSIGTDAFAGCTNLTNVKVMVEDMAKFCNNQVVGQIKASINKPVTLIDSEGNEITEYVIPDGVKSIGTNAFYNCIGLTNVTIPSTVTSIGADAFTDCTGLTTVKVVIADMADFSVISAIKLRIDKPVILVDSEGNEITEYVIPENVLSIGANAFYNCTGLTSVTIPKSVKRIGDGAFGNCPSLTEVYCYVLTPLTINANTFSNRFNATLYVPVGSKSAYQNADYWKDFKSIKEMGVDEPTDIEDVWYDATPGKTIKVFKNGRVKILKDGKVYDLNGTREK